MRLTGPALAGRKRLRQERGEEEVEGRRERERERVGVTVCHHGLDWDLTDHQADHHTSHPAQILIFHSEQSSH